MSLSFVASTVQTGTSDGRYEETPIESKVADDVNRRNANKPLFEQLRANQEEEQAKQDDEQRELMRGTAALDEEDVAHLDALDKHRRERERDIQMRTQDELAMFRAARSERRQIGTSLGDDGDDGDDDNKPLKTTATKREPSAITNKSKDNVKSTPSLVFPKIVVKKRKRRREAGDTGTKKPTEQGSEKKTDAAEPAKEDPEPKTQATGGLGGLLSGYGSSDSD
jgi:hypothetical protein